MCLFIFFISINSLSAKLTLSISIGDNCKLFICGDFMQSDINGKSGFAPMFDLFNDEESVSKGIHSFKFGREDILRSEILKFIIKKLDSKNYTR